MSVVGCKRAFESATVCVRVLNVLILNFLLTAPDPRHRLRLVYPAHAAVGDDDRVRRLAAVVARRRRALFNEREHIVAGISGGFER